MPNLLHIRPCDAEEAIGAWIMAIDHKGPTVLGLNRGAVPRQKGTDRIKMQRGAYVIEEEDDAKVTLLSTGSEVYQCVEAAKLLKEAGIPARIVSMPSMRRFDQQDQEYIQSVLPLDGRPIISVEAMSMHGWGRWYVRFFHLFLNNSLTTSQGECKHRLVALRYNRPRRRCVRVLPAECQTHRPSRWRLCPRARHSECPVDALEGYLSVRHGRVKGDWYGRRVDEYDFFGPGISGARGGDNTRLGLSATHSFLFRV